MQSDPKGYSALQLLSLYNSIREAYESAREKVLSLESAATKTVTTITGMPKGQGQDRDLTYARLVDAKDEMFELLSKQTALICVLTRMYVGAELPKREQDILRNRYMNNMSWAKVKEFLEYEEPISERQMYYNHKKALDSCDEWIRTIGFTEADLEKIKEREALT